MRLAAPVALCLLLVASSARAFRPALPTDNDALFRSKPEEFYMFTDRGFEGRKTCPWQGGTYGFSRNPERIGGEILETKFHEGIDVAPLRRDAAGDPLDEVRAVDSGRVVHASNDARDSNYGKYAVLRHDAGGTPVYTIYAHMAAIDVSPGQSVAKGARLGRMGCTGAGIDRRRAHLHFEIAVLWHDQFETWHAANFPTPNKHGVYNGINMMGLDAAGLYLAQREDSGLTLAQFVQGQKPFFRVQIPESPHFQLPRRYPWLVEGGARSARSWIVSFTAAGFPVSIETSEESVPTPRVVWAAASAFPYDKVTRSLVAGRAGSPRLGESGEKLMSLLSWDPATVSQAEAGP
ncbi:MAG: M23 family metallopeptidase [Chthoniobacterales bacterium]|nr:M23 family metallopeptidase [Chthoniobacterales bacterium]